jgi:hypothetical protein
MNKNYIYVASAIVAVLLIGVVVFLRRPKKLKNALFVTKWRELQRLCADRKNWPFALKDADCLLDKALKKRRYKGKTMGARLMAAQRQIKDNDGIWAAHNLTKKILELTDADKTVKLTKTEVKESLQSYQEALTDLGALRRAPEKK